MYKVKVYFTDLQDGDYPYNAGDTFPRAGFVPSADRIKELSGTQNKRGIALIEEVREAAKPVTEEPVSVETEPRKRTKKQKSE